MPRTYKRVRRYNWEEWFSQDTFKIKRGKDYDCMPHSMAGQIRNYASRYSFHIKLAIHEDTITVKVQNPKKGI